MSSNLQVLTTIAPGVQVDNTEYITGRAHREHNPVHENKQRLPNQNEVEQDIKKLYVKEVKAESDLAVNNVNKKDLKKRNLSK